MKEEQYFKVMGNFIRMASEEETFGLSDESSLIFYEIIQQLAEYLAWTMAKGR
jgi:ABC-type tungstate transport system permease subunit